MTVLQTEAISPADLLRWLWPRCDHDSIALQYRGSEEEMRTGWVYGEENVKRACKAFADGRLARERFECITKQGTHYTIEGAARLGLVLHRQGVVRCFCIDLDDHTGDGGNVHLLESLSKFIEARPVVFTSKSGQGVHAFFELRKAIPVDHFVAWAKAWGFNREGQPELFPKTAKLSQVYMPGPPNADGGDTYQSGTFESSVVSDLPDPPPIPLTSAALSFLRGERDGLRNNGYNVACFHLGEKRIDRETAWRLCSRGALLCGLEPGETKNTFESGYSAGLNNPNRAGRVHRRDDSGDYELDGIGNGERFAVMHRDRARYCVQENDWYAYKTNRWVRSAIEAQGMAKATARSINDQAARRRAGCKQGIKDMLYLAASEPGISVDVASFDGDPMLLNTQSGTIDLRTGKVRSHRASDLLRRFAPVGYAPNSDCPVWLSFLSTVTGGDDELIGYLQRVCGYVLTGDVSEQCLFFMFGDGCNGKSVFCSMLQHILGSYAIRMPVEAVMQHDRSAGATPDMVRLQGARLALTTELDEGKAFAGPAIKNTTGGDRLVARALYANPVEFDPTHKLLLYGNHKPRVTGTDHGIWRRMRLIPFTVTISDEQRDPHLIDKLKAETDAILGWMVRGCLQWQRDGLGMPAAVRKATESYRIESDAVGRFIEECCDLAEGVETEKPVLYALFKAWCETNGESVLSAKAFHPRLVAKGVLEGRKNKVRTWIGISIREGTA